MRRYIPLLGIVAIGAIAFLMLSHEQHQPRKPNPRPDDPRKPLLGPTLLVFTMDGCGPCAKLKKSMKDERVAEELERFTVRELDIGSEEAKEFGARSAPTLVIVDPPRRPNIKTGYQSPKQLLSWLRSVKEYMAGKFVPGGARGPGGIEIATDLPKALRMKNTGGIGPRGPGSGSGLCVFTSLEHSGRWVNARPLWGLQEKMTHEEGGGWPEKVDKMLKKYCPGARYIQYEGKDPKILELALETGRMPAVTYNGHDGVFYHGVIAHMVNSVYLKGKDAAILDNNNPDKILWMSRQEFLDRWCGRGNGWAVVLLDPRPPAPPCNLKGGA